MISLSPSVVEVEGDVADVTANEDGNGSNPNRKVRGKQFPTFQDDDKYPFLENPDPRNEELLGRQKPPWEDKGRTTKAWKDVAEKLSKDNSDIFPMGVKDGMIKKRFKGAIEFMMKFQGTACVRTGCDDETIK